MRGCLPCPLACCDTLIPMIELLKANEQYEDIVKQQVEDGVSTGALPLEAFNTMSVELAADIGQCPRADR